MCFLYFSAIHAILFLIQFISQTVAELLDPADPELQCSRRQRNSEIIPVRIPFMCILFLTAIHAILFLIHFISHTVAELLDPADPELRALDSKKPVPEFDRNKHAHVIENGRCHLCNITISSQRTKHCSGLFNIRFCGYVFIKLKLYPILF